MTNQQVEPQRENPQGSQFFSVQGNVSTPTGHQQPEQTNGKQCPGCSQLTKGTLSQEGQPTATRKVEKKLRGSDRMAAILEVYCD